MSKKKLYVHLGETTTIVKSGNVSEFIEIFSSKLGLGEFDPSVQTLLVGDDSGELTADKFAELSDKSDVCVKVGLEMQFTILFQLNPVDPLPLSKVVSRARETLFLLYGLRNITPCVDNVSPEHSLTTYCDKL